MDLNKVDEILAAQLEKKHRRYLLQEIPRGELLLDEADPDSPEHAEVVNILTRMYWVIGSQLGLICDLLKYSLKQWEWKDSEPLLILAKFFPGIETTKWYQWMLGTVLDPSDHPWMQVIPPNTPFPYPLLSESDGRSTSKSASFLKKNFNRN